MEGTKGKDMKKQIGNYYTVVFNFMIFVPMERYERVASFDFFRQTATSEGRHVTICSH